MKTVKLSEFSRFGCNQFVSELEFSSGRYPIEEIIRKDMARNMADGIQDKHLKRIEHEHSVEFRMDVYVLTPDELHGLMDAAVRRSQEGCPGDWYK